MKLFAVPRDKAKARAFNFKYSFRSHQIMRHKTLPYGKIFVSLINHIECNIFGDLHSFMVPVPL